MNTPVQQAKLAELKPQLERLKKRHAKDSHKHILARETMALYKRNGIRLMDPLMLASMAIQLPLLGGLFAAINTLLRAGLGAGKRYLWIADLTRPDVLLAVVASALVAGSVALAPQTGEGAQAATMLRISIVLAAGWGLGCRGGWGGGPDAAARHRKMTKVMMMTTIETVLSPILRRTPH